MQRIRTIKPEFFQHEALFDLEVQVRLPVRLAFAGLLTCCDREGRFKWRPRKLKTDVLPYDDVNFLEILDALVQGGFVLRYVVEGETYGCIPTWRRHQVVNIREAKSTIPPPIELDRSITPISTPDAAPESMCTHVRASGEVEVEVEMEMEREEEGKGSELRFESTKKPNALFGPDFDSEAFLSELRKAWPRADFGFSSEIAAMEALEFEMRETSLSAVPAAEGVLARICRVAQLVNQWPREQKRLIPGLTSLLKNRTYRQDDCFWEYYDNKESKHDQRERVIRKIAGVVAAAGIDDNRGGLEEL